MRTERQDRIFKEIQELKRRLSLVERKAAAVQKPKPASVRNVFQKKYPHVRVDPQLLRLVGIDPPLSLAEEKRELRNAIAARFTDK
ncbi:MAG: hypothetical protein ACRD2L_11635 [Terriglobia bacterium]